MKILIDADGCPVVDLTLRAAAEAGVKCVILCDTAHRIERPGAETLVFDQGADSVDFALVSRAEPGDVVVTQDYGLAAMCLSRRAAPIRQDGLVYDEGNIEALLTVRAEAKRIRRGGGRLKGPPKRTAADDRAYEASLRALLLQKMAAAGEPVPVILPLQK